jgi:hypothetical protein
MAHPYHHAVSSAKKFGGEPGDYAELHAWFDESKTLMATAHHRMLRHHAAGIFELEKRFGMTITNSAGKAVPVRLIGEQHVIEDLGFIPSFEHWVVGIARAGVDSSGKPRLEPWFPT